MLKITSIALLLAALTIGSASAYAASSDVVCAAVYAPCNEDGTVKEEFASGECAETYQQQCDKEYQNAVAGLQEDLGRCQGSLLNALIELQNTTKELQKKIKNKNKRIRNLRNSVNN